MYSCKVPPQIDSDQNTVYEFSIGSSTIKPLKKFGENESEPFFRYFHNSNKKMISHYYSFFLIDEFGNEEEIKSDSVFIGNSFYFDISPNNREVIYSGSVIKGNNFMYEGLYKLDLNTKKISLFHLDPSGIANYPVYSSSGNKILYTVRGFGSGQEVGSKLVIMDAINKDCETLDSNDYSTIRYARFSTNDSLIYYFISPHEIYRYDLFKKEKNLIIGNQNFATDYDFTSGFPLFNLSRDALYFYSSDNTNGLFTPYKLYKYNLLTSSIEKLFTGRQPMSITDNYILYRDDLCNICGVYTSTNIKLVNKVNLSDSTVISPGDYGTISEDEKFILFSWTKNIIN
jgi:hypothetical protein